MGEYGKEVEITINVKDDNEETDNKEMLSFVSDFWLFAIIGILLLLCCLSMILTLFCFHKKNKLVKQKRTNLEITSIRDNEKKNSVIPGYVCDFEDIDDEHVYFGRDVIASKGGNSDNKMNAIKRSHHIEHNKINKENVECYKSATAFI